MNFSQYIKHVKRFLVYLLLYFLGGHDANDVELMNRKINYLKHMVPHHPNIVRYMGDTDESEEGFYILLRQ